MADPYSQLMGTLLMRLILVAAGVVVVWTAWNGLWQYTAGLGLALAYLLYISWRSTDVEDHQIDPRYWDR